MFWSHQRQQGGSSNQNSSKEGNNSRNPDVDLIVWMLIILNTI